MVFILIIFGFFFASPSYAQPTSGLFQVVTDPSGACTRGMSNRQNIAVSPFRQFVCAGSAGLNMGTWTALPGAGGGGGSVCGADKQVQFNDATACGVSTGITYDKTLHILTVVGGVATGDGTVAGESVQSELLINGANYRSWLAADSLAANLRMKHADAVPAANQTMRFPAPTSSVSQYAWANPAWLDQSNTWPTGDQDFGSAASLKVPVSGGCTVSVNGRLCYDSTNQMLHAAQNGADAYIPESTANPADGDCATWSVSGGTKKINTYGAPCPMGGGGGSGVGQQSGSLTFGAIPDLGCVDQSFTFTGITTATQLQLGLPSTINSGLLFNVFASASNTVTVRGCNSSGGAITLGALSFTAKIASYYLTGTATPTWSAIPDAGCADQTFTLTGIAAGDPIVLGEPAAVAAGLFFNAIGSATNTVDIRGCNWSGGAITPTGTFTATAAK